MVENLKKDVELADMEKKIRPNMFLEFRNELSSDTMERLHIIGLEEKNDSSFVLASVRGLYHDRIDDLAKKTVTGRSKSKGTKEAISPSKMSIIKNMFERRLEMSGCALNTQNERKAKINLHVKKAIENINKHKH